ncbi:MAG TPA: TonB-dependent receptor plug domain-containing protein [Polyangiaceae bacterium]|nr:TonB-dependent receptor plug domain-containing protein [Polyangiaceae bacterium]
MTITVQGAPRDPIAASSTLVTAREFSAMPRRSAEDALRLVPGVTVVQHGSEGKGYQFLVRGFDAQHGADFAVSVDGVPLNEWSNVHAQGYLDLGFVIPELISVVQVTKGPFTLKQGGFAMAGSADYHLGVAEEDRGLRTAYTLGSTNRHRGPRDLQPAGGRRARLRRFGDATR